MFAFYVEAQPGVKFRNRGFRLIYAYFLRSISLYCGGSASDGQ